MVLSLHKQPFVTTYFQFITAHFVRHCALKNALLDREPLLRYGHSKLSKMAASAILNLFESKIAPLDPPSPKTPPYNKYEVDRTTGCGDMAI